MQSSQPLPIQKNVVLVGAGNAHLQFVKMFGMKPVPGLAVTLVSEKAVIPYSAMVPGHIGGDYQWHEITMDLVRLCRASGVRFLAERAIGVDRVRRRVLFANRPELGYDALSLGLGSLSVHPPGIEESPRSWILRPLGRLLAKLADLQADLTSSPRPFHFVVVGGGASGCELALAIHKRLVRVAPGLRVTLLQGNPRLLPEFPLRAGEIFAESLRQRGITVRTSTRVTAADEAALEINGDEQLAYDTVLWATNAAPPPLLANIGLPCSADGFLRVRDTLQSVDDPDIFGTGDCVSFDSHPHLIKNGVYAVREGKILFRNIPRLFRQRRLTRFRPQARCLCLLNTSDGDATFCYGPIVWKSRAARRLKDRIDRAWIDKFTRFKPMAVSSNGEETPMHCGGCGSKVSGDVLSSVLRRLQLPGDDRIVMGAQAGEDASVHRLRPETFSDRPDQLVEVQTVDYFRAFIDDPYLFGRIAAINAVSDLYAMNARPFSALAIATLPYARGPVQEAMLHELLSGAVETLQSAGVVLTGGHTTEGSELALGFAVTGYAEEDTLFTKGALQPGDVLIVTKPLGSGAILAAWMRGECPASWLEKLVQNMLQTNKEASAIFRDLGIQACTDVTGFGLAGHLLEMLDASGLSAKIQPASVRLYEGFAEVVNQGIVSSLHADNAKVSCRVIAAGSPATSPAWLYDPQTSGGMLAGVPPQKVETALQRLHDAGYLDTFILGETATNESNGSIISMG